MPGQTAQAEAMPCQAVAWLVQRSSLLGKMVKNLLDDHGILHTGYDAHRPLALLTGLNVIIECSFQSLGPGHRRVALGEAAVIPFLISLLASLAPARWCDQSPAKLHKA